MVLLRKLNDLEEANYNRLLRDEDNEEKKDDVGELKDNKEPLNAEESHVDGNKKEF